MALSHPFKEGHLALPLWNTFDFSQTDNGPIASFQWRLLSTPLWNSSNFSQTDNGPIASFQWRLLSTPLWNSSNFSQTDNGPFSSFQWRLLSTSSFKQFQFQSDWRWPCCILSRKVAEHFLLLYFFSPSRTGVLSLVLYLLAVPQDPQRFRSFMRQATHDSWSACQFITHQHMSLLPLTLVQQMWPFISSGTAYPLHPHLPPPPPPPSPSTHTHQHLSLLPLILVQQMRQSSHAFHLVLSGPPRTWCPLLHGFGVEPSLVCVVHAWTQLACLSIVNTNTPWGYTEEVWGGGGGGGGERVEPSEVCVVHVLQGWFC